MKRGTFGTLSALAAEIDRQNSTKRDFITNTVHMEIHPSTEEDPMFKVSSFVPGYGLDCLDIQPLALEQIGTKSEIPLSYQRKLAHENPKLLAHNINTLHKQFPANRMVRSLDGQARAFMSDKYKRIDNFPVLETILPILLEKGDKGELKVESCDVTNNNMYLKVVAPKLEAEVKVGSVVSAAALISNSEVGLGSWMLKKMLYTLACLNGMTMGKEFGGINRRHIGARQNEGILYRDDTIYADQRAFALQVRDTIEQMFDQNTFFKTIEMLRETTTRKIGVRADPSKVIIELGKEVGFSQSEGASIMQHLIQGGDLSQYGLANAVTRYAQDDEVSYDRSTDLEAIGGKIIDLTGRKLERILEAA